MNRTEIGIIIPAFNEEKTIAEVVNSVKKHGITIVVNDCSTDRTAPLAEDSGAVVTSHESNLGYDQALNTGFRKAYDLGCKFVITFDADGQHSSKIIEQFLALYGEGVELVLGTRPKPARYSEYLFAAFTKIRFKIKDPLCGMKGYSIGIYLDLGHFDSYSSIGTELAFFALKNKCRYQEIPISINAREDKPRFHSTFRANVKIFRSLIYSVFK
jgi:glycosyltransferase involved in cell wall biosynthesis